MKFSWGPRHKRLPQPNFCGVPDPHGIGRLWLKETPDPIWMNVFRVSDIGLYRTESSVQILVTIG